MRGYCLHHDTPGRGHQVSAKKGKREKCMQAFARAFMTVVFVLASGLAFAAQQPAYQATDLDRWLEEDLKISGSPASEDAQKAQYAESVAAGNIFAPLALERIAQNRKEDGELEKWKKTSQANNVVTVLHQLAASDARAQALLGLVFSGGLAAILLT